MRPTDKPSQAAASGLSAPDPEAPIFMWAATARLDDWCKSDGFSGKCKTSVRLQVRSNKLKNLCKPLRPPLMVQQLPSFHGNRPQENGSAQSHARPQGREKPGLHD